uniref:Uncharacterized protein n=1 Tax=Timema douglasi TaxID=61478 RepID=A0A7R8VQK9_TIMDO|nr:unnamed protein product [Timema douglasi]
MKLGVLCVPVGLEEMQVIGMDWYDGRHGYIEENCPVLAICFDNGCMQIMKDENDDAPVLIDTGMAAVCCSWNHNGSVIAVTGTMQLSSDSKDSNVIQFFTPFGEHLRTLKIPGREVSCCVWDGSSLRLALAVNSHIFFANIRPHYRWTYFEHTVVYCYNRPDKPGTIVSFWDITNNECYNKLVKYLLGIASFGEHCVLATKADDSSTSQFALILCNAISTPVDKSCKAGRHLESYTGEWVKGDPVGQQASRHSDCSRQRKERLYHIDDSPSGIAEVIQDLDRSYEVIGEVSGTSRDHHMIASHEATRKQHAHNATPLIFPVMSFHSGRKQCARVGMFVDKTSHTQTEKRGTFVFYLINFYSSITKCRVIREELVQGQPSQPVALDNSY